MDLQHNLKNRAKTRNLGKIEESSGRAGNRKKKKTEKNWGRTGEWEKLARNAILPNFDLKSSGVRFAPGRFCSLPKSGNLSVAASSFIVLARFCRFCAIFVTN